jgi:hypothetical protein
MSLPQDPPISPTHTCFDDALDFIVAVLQPHPAARQALAQELCLVHGICRAPDGQPYAHAWVEHQGRCIFRGLLEGNAGYFAARQEAYYAELRVEEVTRYSVPEALAANRHTNTYGPWVPKYLALCGTRTAPDA